MQQGYYWIFLGDETQPEVVEIDGDKMYRCGSDVVCLFENGRWTEFGEALDVVHIIGPLLSPAIPADPCPGCMRGGVCDKADCGRK